MLTMTMTTYFTVKGAAFSDFARGKKVNRTTPTKLVEVVLAS